MKETPIIFKPRLVRANFEGIKDRTRRTNGLDDVNRARDAFRYAGVVKNPLTLDPKDRPFMQQFHMFYGNELPFVLRCPYGGAGDLLWVRENWRAPAEWDHHAPRFIPEETPVYYANQLAPSPIGKTRPSIFMPRWASRQTLRIVKVWAERLSELDEENALKDGGWQYNNCPIHKEPVKSFYELWDSINGKKPMMRVEDNPFVWVVQYEVVKDG